MPTKPFKPCNHPGCSALVPSGYCAAHRRFSPASHYEERRRNDESTRIRRGSNWRKISLLVRTQQPLCCDPLNLHGGWPVPSAQVHHVIPAEARPDLIFDLENCAAVCVRCHNDIEAMHRAGKPTAHLFKGKAAA